MEPLLEGLKVHGVLGHGSNGVVLSVSRGKEGSDGGGGSPTNPFALKIVSHFWDEEARELLSCEHSTLSRLAPHPNIIATLASFEATLPAFLHSHLLEDMRVSLQQSPSQHTRCFFFEAHALSLDKYRAAFPAFPFPFHLLHGLASDLLSGACHLAACRVGHMDLKLDNVLLSRQGRAVIADFGISCCFPGVPGEPLLLPYRQPLPILVNRAVLPPEVLRGLDGAGLAWEGGAREGLAVDCSAQGVWAVGSILYELACGAPLLPDTYRDATPPGYAAQDLPALPPAYPPAFAALLRSLVAPCPTQRPSAQEAQRALAGLWGGLAASLAGGEQPPPSPLLLHLRHWSGASRLVRLGDEALAAEVLCKDVLAMWRVGEPLLAPPGSTAGGGCGGTGVQGDDDGLAANCRLFLGGLELAPGTPAWDTPCKAFLPTPSTSSSISSTAAAAAAAAAAEAPLAGLQNVLCLDLAPPLAAVPGLSAAAHLAFWGGGALFKLTWS